MAITEYVAMRIDGENENYLLKRGKGLKWFLYNEITTAPHN